MRRQQKTTVTEKLNRSPINYFSDLFVAAMVVVWIVVLIITIGAAIYSMICFCDTSVWSYVENMATVPLTAGGAIWMIKNSVQHAIANNRGERAHEDFPKVEGTETDSEVSG